MTIAESQLSNNAAQMRRGILLTIAGSLIIPGLDAAAKLLVESSGMGTLQVAFLRFALQTAFVFPLVVLFDGMSALRVRRPLTNLLRGVLLGLASLCFFEALKFMPLADATAIFFVEPMCVTVLAALLLKERIDARRVFAVLVGFAGAMLIIRPSFSALGFVAVLPLGTAALVALYSVLGRHIATSSTPLAMHLYSGLGGTLVLGLCVLLGVVTASPDLAFVMPRGPEVWALLLVVGVVATVGHLMFITAYRLTPASLLAPFGYVEIVSAVILGLLIFGDRPDATTLLGIGVIAASGIFLVWQESKREGSVPPLHDGHP